MLDFNVRSFCHNSIMLINDAAVAAVEGVFLYTKGVSVPRNVTRVCIHHSVKHIPLNAFSGCTALVEVELHDGLRSIGEGAFNECSSLLRIIIPPSVSDILYRAFSGCTALVERAFVRLTEGIWALHIVASYHHSIVCHLH